MNAYSHSRGHKIEYDFVNKIWLYCDNGQIFDDTRPCLKCGKYPTKEGHDACLGFLSNVKSACCGHGVKKGFTIK